MSCFACQRDSPAAPRSASRRLPSSLIQRRHLDRGMRLDRRLPTPPWLRSSAPVTPTCSSRALLCLDITLALLPPGLALRPAHDRRHPRRNLLRLTGQRFLLKEASQSCDRVQTNKNHPSTSCNADGWTDHAAPSPGGRTEQSSVLTARAWPGG